MAEPRYNIQWTPEEGVRPLEMPTTTPTEREPTRTATREEPFDGDLTQSDLLEYENLNRIRSYMIDRKGIQYRDKEPEEVVDDFMEHMRFFNTNLVSTGGEVRFITNASEEEKARAAEAYQLYDQLGSVFANDGFFGAVEGVGEYIQAAALDPSNYIGLLTGGLGKAGAFSGQLGGRALIRQAAREASERAMASGATREAAEAAGQRAADRTIQRLARRNVTGDAATEVAERVAQSERNRFLARAGSRAEAEGLAGMAATDARRALYATTALDGTFAALNDYQIQNVMLDVGVQEEYSRTQTALSSVFGLVGGGLQLAGRQFRGASGLSDSRVKLEDARTRADQENLIRSALSPDEIDKSVEIIDNAKLEPMTGLTLGETAGMGQRLSDLFSKDISVAGRTLNVMSQVKKTINGGVVHANNMMDTLARQDAVQDAINVEAGKIAQAGKVGQYVQSVWRRLLVSSPATSMINVAGYAQFSFGQTVADLFNAGTFALYGLARGGNLTAAGREALQSARVYSTIQAQKMRNFADPFTTHDTYMELLAQNPELEKRLFESFTGGVDRNIAKFNLNPNSTAVKVTESLTEAANNLTGVRIQDSFTKSQMFITELDKNLRLTKGQSLEEVMSTGLIDDIFDDDIINPALDTTLKSVYSKNYTTDDQGMLADVAKLIESISNTPVIGTVLPFGRFLNNTVATVYQWSPVSFFPAATRIMKKSSDAGEKIMAREAFARSAVGTAGLVAAWEYDQDRLDKGLAYNEIELSDGTIIDAKNTFPFSLFLVLGRMTNLQSRGQPIPEELSIEFGTQVGVGQAATDLQFGNDMVAVYDSIFNIGSDEGGRADLYKGLMRGLGNWTAGFTRPLDAVNKAVGYFDNTDAARDLRQAEGVELFTQASSRYLDNIFEAMFDRVDGITGEELRVASREGAIRDANPLARIFGVNVRPARTATEQAYSMANMAEWTASERSQLPEYDRIFNSTIAPRLERAMERLLRDQRYIDGDTRTRKIMLTERLGALRNDVRASLGAGTGESQILSLRRRATRHGNKSQRSLAMQAMRENFGFEGEGIRDMSIRELNYFMDYIDYLDYALE
jgi:hypothetical protein